MESYRKVEETYLESQKRKCIEEKRQIRIVFEKIFSNKEEKAYKWIWWCKDCHTGIMRRNEKKDYSFSKDTLNGEGFWECWECDSCGREDFEPFD